LLGIGQHVNPEPEVEHWPFPFLSTDQIPP
jgi:hypothetical protein